MAMPAQKTEVKKVEASKNEPVSDEEEEAELNIAPVPIDNGRKPEKHLWIEKYGPRSSRDLVGNVECLEKFRTWLRDWNEVCIHGK